MNSKKIVEELIPRNIWGKPLGTGQTKKDKQKRIKHYLFDSLIFAVVMCFFDIIAIFVATDKTVFDLTDYYVLNFILTVFLTGSILFVISFILDYLVGERAVKTYNRGQK